MSEKQPRVQKGLNGLLNLTQHGRNDLEGWVTDLDERVYAFTPNADPLMVAAAMARLSRNSNGLRPIIADEFLGKDGDEEKLLERVVTQYGDDSVMQLYPVQLAFEGISNLATKVVESGRLAAYLEQSSRYLRFDKKDDQGNYLYLVPEEFDAETKELYVEQMDKIFDIYSELYEGLKAHIISKSDVPDDKRDGAWRNAVHAQACDGVRALLPASTKANVGMVGSAQAVGNMLLNMEAHQLPEAQQLGKLALRAVRDVAPVFFQRIDMPERGKLVTNHKVDVRNNIADPIKDVLGSLVEQSTETGRYVRLESYFPHVEDEAIAYMVYEHSDKSLSEIKEALSNASDQQKAQLVAEYAGERFNRRAKPGRAFEYPHYSFDVQADYGAYRDIQRHRLVDTPIAQPLNPYLDHVRSKAIQEAGLEDKYESAFTLNQRLFEELSARGYDSQAQYAVLFGNNMRFHQMYNARSFTHSAELRTTPQGHPAYRSVYQDMHRHVSEVHPNIAKSMKFMSSSEDEALARLGAERYQQTKFGDSELEEN